MQLYVSVDPEFISMKILPKYICLEESHIIYLCGKDVQRGASFILRNFKKCSIYFKSMRMPV